MKARRLVMYRIELFKNGPFNEADGIDELMSELIRVKLQGVLHPIITTMGQRQSCVDTKEERTTASATDGIHGGEV